MICITLESTQNKNKQYFFKYACVASILAVAGNLLASFFATLVTHLVFTTQVQTADHEPLFELSFIELILFAPMFESVLLGLFVCLLLRSKLSPTQIIYLSALLWAILHGLFDVERFLGTLCGFIIFNYAFVNWYPKGFWIAVLAAFIPHSFNNLIAFLLITFISGN